MKITRAVITDLLPVYLAGEASEDTKKIVDEFLRDDPEFAELIAKQDKSFEKIHANPSKDNEMKTLKDTKSLLRKRSLYLAFAILFTLFPVSFSFNETGVDWMWADAPIIAIVFAIIGVAMWIGYARTNRRLNGSGL